ncbi:signal recognition particle-docking protein FtsY [Pelagibacteraceae bacterium]|nr:signal recognition particle-docking protein FtsY [Pelagibacteraceae bacterium]
MNLFLKFKNKLSKTSNFLSLNILETFKNKKVDTNTLEELESVLISSDISLDVVDQLIDSVRKVNASNNEVINVVFENLAKKINEILSVRTKKLIDEDNNTKKIILFVGVNGSGKTTTLGKIANKLLNKKVLIAACDTFRAAAVDQLEDWAKKNNNDFISGKLNQDPASIAYEACKKYKSENYDYLLIDTAGRLSNNTNLINQLIKLKNVISKIDKDFNIDTVLVLDGTNGSNMIKQAEIFGKALNVSSLIITKLDGTAKGGALISIANKYEIPISYVGLGEKVEDLIDFNPQDFARSILGLNNKL